MTDIDDIECLKKRLEVQWQGLMQQNKLLIQYQAEIAALTAENEQLTNASLMHYLKIPLSDHDLERLTSIAAARNPAPTLPNLAIEALNSRFNQILDPPIPPSKRVGNPDAAKLGREVAARRKGKRKPKGESQ